MSPPRTFRYLDAKQLEVAGVPCLALRIGFVGELGYELHFPSPAGEHLWDRLLAEGARPFGLEPQRVLRLEKGHVIVGQDTDSESNLLSAGMPWLPKIDKDDFVGKYALEHFAEREARERLVGFTMEEDVVPAEGAQIVVEGRPAGRVTSARRSEQVGAGHRPRLAAAGPCRGRHAVRDPGRPAAPRRARHARRVLRPGRGADARHERARLPLAVRAARPSARVAARACLAGAPRERARPLARRQGRAPRRPRRSSRSGRRGARPPHAAARPAPRRTTRCGAVDGARGRRSAPTT